MATVVRESEPVHEHVHTDGGNSTGLILGVILILLVLFLFFYYGLPALRGGLGNSTTVNVPKQVDVNVNKTQ